MPTKLHVLHSQPGPLNTGDVFVRLFNSFVLEFAQKINLLKFAQFAVHASRSLGSAAAMIDFLQAAVSKLEEMKMPKAKEPILFLKMHVAQHQVETVRGKAASQVSQPDSECLGSLSPDLALALGPAG